MGDERRRWKRLEAEVRLGLHIVEPDGRARRVAAVGSHISPEGIFVQVADPPPAGSKVSVRVAGDGAEGALAAEGEVTNREVLDDQSERPPGIGIRLSPSPGWRALYGWLASAAPAEED